MRVWESSHVFALSTYKALEQFPKIEQYALVDQIRRAVVSIPSNIAEGCGRSSDKDFLRFLSIALGSANESEYQLYLAFQLGYINADAWQSLEEQVNTIKKMLITFLNKLQK